MSQNKRTTGKEQYYTPRETAEECLRLLEEHTQSKRFLEPAGGTGSFVSLLRERGYEVVSYDIEPKGEGIQRTDDFLKEDISSLKDFTVITNPPFGRANALSVPFFNKCAEVAEVIGFLVPKSWRKWSVMNKLNRNFHLVSDTEMTVDYVYPGSSQKSKGKLNTIFQVWVRREEMREIYDAEDRGYIQKVSVEDANVSLTVFGRGCGRLRTVFPRKKNTTQMFLKCSEEIVEVLKQLDYKRFYSNTAFVEALSIKEIWCLLNEYMDKCCLCEEKEI